MFEVKFRNLAIAPTMSAYRELEDLGLDLTDVKEVLEKGFDCQKSKRRAGVLERCLRTENKVLRVVVAKDYQIFSKKEVWAVIHVSKHAWKTYSKGGNENEMC